MHIPSHPVHTAAHCNPLQPAANHPVLIQCTHCSSHYIFSAHCSHVQPCTAICSQPLVHTAANCSYPQPSTMQLYHHIQCTLQLHYLVPILYSASSAPLDHHRVRLYHYWPTSRAVSRHDWLTVAVHKMKKTG